MSLAQCECMVQCSPVETAGPMPGNTQSTQPMYVTNGCHMTHHMYQAPPLLYPWALYIPDKSNSKLIDQ